MNVNNFRSRHLKNNMILKSILLRIAQIQSAAIGLYLFLMGGTFLFESNNSLASKFVLSGIILWIIWAILSFVVSRVDQELCREAATAVYPSSALIALAIAVFMGSWLEDLVTLANRQMWPLILAGVLIAIVMIIKCMDIQWLRDAQEIDTFSKRKRRSDD